MCGWSKVENKICRSFAINILIFINISIFSLRKRKKEKKRARVAQ
jgi:hypothetical protein